MSVTEKNIHALMRVQVVKQPFNYRRPYLPENPFSSVGTGFIVNIDGRTIFFMTAAHVVADSQQVTVRFPPLGLRRFKAVVRKTSNKYDMALLMVEIPDSETMAAIKPTVMHLASQAEIRGLERGEDVQAYGYPDGLQQPKASAGVFNGLERHELMHDAATSPGSSGGPLLSVRLGKVIGVVSWKIVKSGVEGVQFTMPVMFAGALIDNKSRGTFVPSLYFGLCVQKAASVSYLLASEDSGARVFDVMASSGAAEAGVKKGDIVTAFDGMSLNAFAQTPSTPWTRQPVSIGELMFHMFEKRRYSIDTERLGSNFIVPHEAKGTMVEYAPPFTVEPSFTTFDGLCLMTSCRNILTSHLGVELQQKKPSDIFNRTWVVIVDIGDGSHAAELTDLQAGMIVKSVAGKEVQTVEDVMMVVATCVRGGLNKNIFIETEDGHAFSTQCSHIKKWWEVVRSRGGRPSNVVIEGVIGPRVV